MIGGLGFAGAASAVVIAPATGDFLAGDGSTGTLSAVTSTSFAVTDGGTGHNLIVPYFTVQDGNMTVIHLTNTDTVNGKAVKVRFRGAQNSDDLLDFQVLMSPGDVWTAAVTAAADGTAQLSTADATCTLPSLKGVTQKFDTRRLPASVGAAGTREGYVEIFNMADIEGSKAWTVAGVPNSQSPLYTTIKHVNGVAPCVQSVIDAAMLKTDHTPATAAFAGLNTPTTGLMGDWYIINVAKTTTFSGAATALTAMQGANVARGAFVVFPQSATGLAAAGVTADNFTADPSLRTDATNVGSSKDSSGAVSSVTPLTLPVVEGAYYDLPDLSTPYLSAVTTDATSAAGPVAQAQLLTQALAVKSIRNQYATDPGITAKTDWVFSMPTRRYSVALDYRGTTPARVFTGGILAANRAPFFYSANTSVDSGKICVTADNQAFYDREETTKTAGAVFSPGNVDKTRFCGETSVLSFGTTGSGVLGAALAAQFTETAAYTNGWGVINTSNGGVGLPILGSAFIKLTNPQASAGVSGNYGITWPHRFTK
jgi:hypothetical protein